jgi:hypothetical protein
MSESKTEHQTKAIKLIEQISSGNFVDAKKSIDGMSYEEILENKDGQNAMHEAIKRNAPPDFIQHLIEKNRKLLTIADNKKQNPLSLVLKKYKENPSDLNLSIVSQIYFAMNKEQRKVSVDASANIINVPFQFSLNNYRSILWRQALEMCFERNGDGKVSRVNLYMLDFVLKVIKEGLYLFGGSYKVDNKILQEYTEWKYGIEVRRLLSKAITSQGQGLANRTLTQANINQTLTASTEFMAQAQIKTPLLIKTNKLDEISPEGDTALIFVNSSTASPTYYFRKNDQLVGLNTLSFDKTQQTSFNALQEIFKGLELGLYKSNLRQSALIRDIEPLVSAPLPKSDAKSNRPSRRTLRGVKAPQGTAAMFSSSSIQNNGATGDNARSSSLSPSSSSIQ